MVIATILKTLWQGSLTGLKSGRKAARPTVSDPLLDKITKSTPEGFFKQLFERQPALYAQALAVAFKEFTWKMPEGFHVLHAVRRALFENELRASALANAIPFYDVPHLGGNCSYVMVKSKPIIFTVHYVDGPCQFVREAESRKQNAGINKWVDYYLDERLFVEAPPAIRKDKPIYINILHGGDFSRITDGLTVDPTSLFIRVAIPDSQSVQYVRNWSVQELIQAYASRSDSAAAQTEIEDKAKPVIRPKKKERGAGSSQ
jgi:hypothetical protein